MLMYLLIMGVQKNQKIESQTEKSVNWKKFGFRFSYGSGGSKIQLTKPKLEFFIKTFKHKKWKINIWKNTWFWLYVNGDHNSIFIKNFKYKI